MDNRWVPAFERFNQKFVKTGGCWEWIGSLSRGNYGRFRMDGKIWVAHRAAWVLARGPIPKGMCVCHACDNPKCVNVKHLWIGTHGDNTRDRDEKGRGSAAYGEKAPSAKLTKEIVKRIRREHKPWKNPMSKLAKQYGVSRGAIKKILYRKTWTMV